MLLPAKQLAFYLNKRAFSHFSGAHESILDQKTYLLYRMARITRIYLIRAIRVICVIRSKSSSALSRLGDDDRCDRAFAFPGQGKALRIRAFADAMGDAFDIIKAIVRKAGAAQTDQTARL